MERVNLEGKVDLNKLVHSLGRTAYLLGYDCQINSIELFSFEGFPGIEDYFQRNPSSFNIEVRTPALFNDRFRPLLFRTERFPGTWQERNYGDSAEHPLTQFQIQRGRFLSSTPWEMDLFLKFLAQDLRVGIRYRRKNYNHSQKS